MAALRLMAGLLLLVATIAFVDDATRMQLAKSRFQSTSIAQHWERLSPTSFNRFKATVRRSTGSDTLGQSVLMLLALPTWAAFLGTGLIIGYVGRRRRRPRTYRN